MRAGEILPEACGRKGVRQLVCGIPVTGSNTIPLAFQHHSIFGTGHNLALIAGQSHAMQAWFTFLMISGAGLGLAMGVLAHPKFHAVVFGRKRFDSADHDHACD